MSENKWPYPSNDRSIALPSGRTIRFYDLIIHTGLGVHSFNVHYRSELDRSRSNDRQAEAEEVIRYFEGSNSCKDAMRANASICSTPAQAATKEIPEEIFQFERNEGGSWRYVGKTDLPPRTAR